MNKQLKLIVKNSILEMIILVLFFIFCFVYYICKIEFTVEFVNTIKAYLYPGRMGNIATFFSIIVAIYSSVIILISTSETAIGRYIILKKRQTELVLTFMFGMIENILVAAVAIFGCEKYSINYIFLITLIIMAFISIGKFIIYLKNIFVGSMNEMAKTIEAQSKSTQRIIMNLDDINRKLK